ncbi:MAG: hypothetical protein HQ592_00520, partial [Planctomycetes bacterium]|nr:hypothetical protein [Planctomycetota bacterium]
MGRARKLILLSLMLVVLAGVVMVLSLQEQPNRTPGYGEDGVAPLEAERVGPTSVEPEESDPGSLPEDLDLGLLTPVQEPNGGPPREAEILDRYQELVGRFFPGRPTIKPEIVPEQVGGTSLSVVKGPLWVTFEKDTGRIRRVLESETFFAIEYAQGDTDGRQVPVVADRRESLGRQFTEILKKKLGVSLGSGAEISEITTMTYHGKSLWSVLWVMRYHGYRHLKDGFNATFELRGGAFLLYSLGYTGNNVCPAKPEINISAEQASDIAKKALTAYYDMIRKLNDKCDFVGRRVIDHKIAFVYRND